MTHILARFSMPIHPTAIIDPSAQIDPTTEIGPYVIIDKDVKIGAGNKIHPFVSIHAGTTIGDNNEIYSYAVIGGVPQHLAYKGEPTRTFIGNNNVFRENVTIHRPFKVESETRVGSDCFFMTGSHVGHDCVLGSKIILTNGCMLAGHVEVGDNVVISGNATVHQFVRIGRGAMMQGLSGISKDLPPFMMASAVNHVAGMNIVGMRRAGISQAARTEIKQAFRILYRQGNSVPRALDALKSGNFGPEVGEIIAFIEGSKRGVLSGERGSNAETGE
ncbi:TPA: acyl-[acyl-carrier-protein]--UDP-N-acetylglucosamine O-acyltransferase [Candidatus Sumerlaeota bacterium]|nr:acyl-[acyl-carrier-protein]--UDP-N-acetylglucosamine O-acyltransferase [Candidatus Sumerlaeota bacterium]